MSSEKKMLMSVNESSAHCWRTCMCTYTLSVAFSNKKTVSTETDDLNVMDARCLMQVEWNLLFFGLE